MTELAILHYSSYPIIGGVEITIYHHSLVLAQAGQRIKIIAGRGEPFDERVLFDRIPELDSKHPAVLAVGAQLAAGDVTNDFSNLRAAIFKRLKESLQGVRTLIVHNAISLHKNLALTAALAELSENQDLQVIGWCHDFAWQDELYTPDLHAGYPWDLLRTAWERVRYVAVSEHRQAMLAGLLDLNPKEIEVIPPGVAVDELFHLDPQTKKLIKQLDLFKAEPLILLPARITRRKNIQFAIRVMGTLRDKLPQARLIITGPPGPHNPSNLAYLEQLQELRATLQVSSKVLFLYEYGAGRDSLHVSNEMMGSLYQIADLLLFPSLREGFGIPTLEAGLFRMPIFAADIPPVRESTKGLALTFDPLGDPEIVGKQILEFVRSDPAFRMRRRVLSKFTWEALVHQRLLPLLLREKRQPGSLL
jgi:glycosyltransferase involved in cell wall biosynthesis